MTTRRWVLAACAITLAWQSAALAGPKEQAIANRIATQIKQSGQLSNYRLGVKFENGAATLLGSVTDQAQAEAAAAIAGQTPGVSRVVNNLEIKAPAQEDKPAEQSNSLLLSLSDAMDSQPQRQPQPAQVEPQLQRVARAPRAQRGGMPAPMAPSRLSGVNPASYGAVQPAQCATGNCGGGYAGGGYPAGGYPAGGGGGGAVGVSYDNANMPGHAWPSYAAHPNYAAVTYPTQYSPAAWPYIGPFYPYPQVPLGWRKVTLEWDDGWWFLDFSHSQTH